MANLVESLRNSSSLQALILVLWLFIYLILFGILTLINEQYSKASDAKTMASLMLAIVIVLLLINITFAIVAGVCLLIVFLKRKHSALVIVWLVWAMFSIVASIIGDLYPPSLFIIVWLMIDAFLIYLWIGVLNFYWKVRDGAYAT